MSASSQSDSIFNQLAATDVKYKARQAAEEAERKVRESAAYRARMAAIVDDQSTAPVSISQVSVIEAPNTRRGFLANLISPLVNKHSGYNVTTLESVLRDVMVTGQKLEKLDIFHYPVEILLGKAEPTNPSTSVNDVDVIFKVKEKNKVSIKTGTEVGNVEGSAYGSVIYKNIFGGAESLHLNASLGTRTRSSYEAIVSSPILSNPNLWLEAGGHASATQKPWASHEEGLRGGWARLKYDTESGHRHEFGYAGTWRQITSLTGNASPTVRIDAGDSVKSALTHTWIRDRRDNPLLPQQGLYAKTMSEIAGWGPLAGDISHLKTEFETQAVTPIPFPLMKGVTFSAGLRGGLLYPLPLGSSKTLQSSRINDRFQLGGPSDVRGFRLGGLGPRDGPDAVGGDIYYAGSLNVLFPLPNLGPERPLRIQAFINGGRLLALSEPEAPAVQEKHSGQTLLTSSSVGQSVRNTLAEMTNGFPSTAAGIGLVYAHPVARFELNLSLPLVVRRGEEARKGFSFGIGINML